MDTTQADRVKAMALALFKQAKKDWGLSGRWKDWLGWASDVHEIGLSIAHAGFHKHGAYLLQYSDLLGFTRQGQAALALLVRSHRRKFPQAEFDVISTSRRDTIKKLAVLLRLAVVLHHSRGAHAVPVPELMVKDSLIMLRLPQDWLETHPLTARDLATEAEYLAAVGWELRFS
ncbi:hypothetical protein A3759_29490 [Thalassolituus sp. HI0120]|nr:hypothetical protein A3759_29490 [Thalassolituus sp. HI0120]